MLKKPCIFILTIMCFLIPVLSFAADNYLFHIINVQILVVDAEKAADQFTQWVSQADGYFLVKSQQNVIVRFPYTRIEEFLALIDKTADQVVEITSQAIDLREQILEYKSGIKSREEIFNMNLKFIDGTDVAGTLALENEISSLLREIEAYKGKLRQATNNTIYAYAEVYFHFFEKSLPEDIPSSFGWINTVDLYQFLDEER
jgi:hypothetical protein